MIDARRGSWGFVVSLTLLMGCNSGECQEGGRTYENGQQWTCSDGCNFCACQEGDVATTALACPMPPGSAAGKLDCDYGADHHRHGDVWTAANCMLSCNDGHVVKDCG